jgi:HD-like signal output (HDOD) protein/CheY-like chemotaxis protein
MSSSGVTETRALVVDDEPLIRGLTIRALSQEGFTCDVAVDGLHAHNALEAGRYDVVITDLRMPNRHGHALATEILATANRPLLIVLTGMLEPRLAKDLIARGVDLVEFKPVHFPLFAAKVRGLLNRRKAEAADQPSVGREPPPLRGAVSAPPPEVPASSPERNDVESKLNNLAKIVPVSQAAVDVFNMTSSNAYEPEEVAQAIARESSLSADVLRLANSAFYNTTGIKILDLAEGVVRIGYKRTGELALATSALAPLSQNLLPWMNMELAWRRSVAAGAAMDLLLASSEHADAQDGLFLGAIMHYMGRIALGMLFPQYYPSLVDACQQHHGLLAEREQQAFQVNHGEVAARLLKSWNIPAGVYEPLAYLCHDYALLARLSEPLRTKVELLKLAVLIGGIAMGPWEPWERLELPSASVLRRLEIAGFSTLINKTRTSAEKIISFRAQSWGAKKPAPPVATADPPPRELAYCSLASEPFDLLAEVLVGMGLTLRPCDGHALAVEKAVLVNCLGTPAQYAAASLRHASASGKRLIITDPAEMNAYATLGPAMALGGSYAALAAACRALAAAAG